jgi:hypothetical protein
LDAAGGLLSVLLNKGLRQSDQEPEWVEWRFKASVPPGYWRKKESQQKFFDWAAKELSINELEGWYNVQVKQLQKLGGSCMFSMMAEKKKEA